MLMERKEFALVQEIQYLMKILNQPRKDVLKIRTAYVGSKRTALKNAFTLMQLEKSKRVDVTGPMKPYPQTWKKPI